MRIDQVVVAGAVVVALTTTASAPTPSAAAELADSTGGPVMSHAQISISACRHRDNDFATARFTAVNRGDDPGVAAAWARNGFSSSWAAGLIGSQGMRGGYWTELGEWATTGSPTGAEFRVRIRTDGGTRTKVLSWDDLPRC